MEEYKLDENGEIINVSDQLYSFAEEVNGVIEKLIEKKKITREQAEKCVELAIGNVRNDVIWKRLNKIDNLCEELNNAAIYIANSIGSM